MIAHVLGRLAGGRRTATGSGSSSVTVGPARRACPSTTPNSTRVPGLSAVTPAGQRVLVHEDVAAVVAGQEAEALLGVVPLDLAGRHGRPLL